MKNKTLLTLVACSPLMLTGCSIQKADAIKSINNNIINVLQNNNTISNSENAKYKFTGYEIWENDKNQTLNVFGKLFNDSKHSYLKLSYNNVDFSNYNFDSEIDSYKSIAEIKIQDKIDAIIYDKDLSDDEKALRLKEMWR